VKKGLKIKECVSHGHPPPKLRPYKKRWVVGDREEGWWSGGRESGVREREEEGEMEGRRGRGKEGEKEGGREEGREGRKGLKIQYTCMRFFGLKWFGQTNHLGS
jgi:hypothetical protein